LGLDGQGAAVIELLLALELSLHGLHGQSLVALHARANLRAGSAAGAVIGGGGHGELHAGHTGHVLHLQAGGSLGGFFLGHDNRTDDGVRADIGAEVTLDAVVGIPLRNIDGDAALLVSSASRRHSAVAMSTKVETGSSLPLYL